MKFDDHRVKANILISVEYKHRFMSKVEELK
jgi:hypothetical protein